MDILAALVASPVRARVIRFFMHHAADCITLEQLSAGSGCTSIVAKRELQFFHDMGLLMHCRAPDQYTHTGKMVAGGRGYTIDTQSLLYAPLRDISAGKAALSPEDIVKLTKPLGKVRLLILSGHFVGRPQAPADMLFVLDKVDEKKAAAVVKEIETLLGHEVRYVLFDVTEFRYRQTIQDRLTRDILDYDILTPIDTLGVVLK
jgi:hypothetical protein